MTGARETTLVIGVHPGAPKAGAPAARSALTISATGEIGLLGRTEIVMKPALARFLREDAIVADERVRLIAMDVPLTSRPLERKPVRARLVEYRFTRGIFAAAARGPQPVWLSAAQTGWLRYQEGLALRSLLEKRGIRLLEMPPEGSSTELPAKSLVEVLPKATLALLLSREMAENRPATNDFLGQLDDWLFPRLFAPRRLDSEETGKESGFLRSRAEEVLEALAPGYRLAPEVIREATRIARLRRPYSRREPLRAFTAAFQAALAVAGAACLVGAEGDGEGSILLPARWHPDWEQGWTDPRGQDPRVRRVGLALCPKDGM
jgi:hypothetical protein